MNFIAITCAIAFDCSKLDAVQRVAANACRGFVFLFVMTQSILLTFPSLADEYSSHTGSVLFERVGMPDDIPQGIVLSLFQDRTGFVWIGTQSGLLRYDGQAFLRFSHKKSEPDSLHSDKITTISETDDGRIWFGSYSEGVAYFEPHSGRFHKVKFAKSVDALSGVQEVSKIQSQGNTLWILTKAGLVRYESDSGENNLIWNVNNGAGMPVYDLMRSASGEVYVATDSGILLLSNSSDQPIFVARFEKVGDKSRPMSMALDHQQRVWTWFADGSVEITYLQNEQASRFISAETIGLRRPVALLSGHEPQMWFASADDGVLLLDEENLQVVHRSNQGQSAQYSLPSRLVNSVMKAKSGVLFVGSWGDGLFRHSPKRGNIDFFSFTRDVESGDSKPNVVSILQLKDGTWLTSNLGGGGIDHLNADFSFRETIAFPENTGHKGWRVNHFHLNDDGTIWLSHTQNGIALFDPQMLDESLNRDAPQQQYIYYDIPDALVSGTQVNNVLPVGDTVWLATRAGLLSLQKSNGLFSQAFDSSGRKIKGFVSRILLDSSANLWVATLEGMYLMAAGKKDFLHLSQQSNTNQTLKSDNVWGLVEDKYGVIWIGTDSGVQRVSSVSPGLVEFEDLSQRLGRQDIHNENLILDDIGNIWIEAAMRFDPKTLETVATPLQSLQEQTIWFGAIAKSQSGNLVFGGPGGILRASPQPSMQQQPLYPMVVTEVMQNDQRQIAGDINSAIRIAPHTTYGSVKFSALYLDSPDSIRYRYRISPFQKNWIEPESKPTGFSFSLMPPGNYELVMQAMDINRNIIAQRGIPLIVEPTFLQRTDVRLILLSCFLLFLYGVYRFQLRVVKNRKNELKRQVMERTRDLSQLAEFGQQLNSNLQIPEICELMYQQVNYFISPDAFLVGLWNEQSRQINFVYGYEFGEVIPPFHINVDQEPDRPVSECIRSEQEIFIDVANIESTKYAHVGAMTGVEMLSVIYLPIKSHDKLIGCVSAQSRAYQDLTTEQLSNFKTLVNFLAVAIANAHHFSLLSKSNWQLKQSNEQLNEANSRLKQLSFTDSLTRIGNRRAGQQALLKRFERAKVAQAISSSVPMVSFSIALADVDNFKRINDTFGHDEGDRVLTGVADAITTRLRPDDNVYRWGGEEFLLIFPGCDREMAMSVCERIRNGVASNVSVKNKRVTLSFGVAEFDPSVASIETLLKQADLALYNAKSFGKNVVA